MLTNLISVLALVLSLTGNLLINKMNRTGFVVWFVANLLWIVINLLTTPNWSQILMFLVYMGFNIQGWKNWGRK